jgi:SOS-response transcriptional repressor LexA
MTSPYGRSYPNGTLIYVDPDVPPQTGKRVIARHSESGDVTFKELAADAGRYYLKPLNPQYETLRTDGGWEVIGTVVASLQPE